MTTETKEKSEDLGIKVVSKEEAIWTKVRDEGKELIKQSQNNLIVQRAMVTMAERKVKEEQRKNRKL